jgi:hypothetical protein
MASGPNERRARAEATDREARAIIEAETKAAKSKTDRLRAERLAREAEAERLAAMKSGAAE